MRRKIPHRVFFFRNYKSMSKEAFHWNISSSINLLILKSDLFYQISSYLANKFLFEKKNPKIFYYVLTRQEIRGIISPSLYTELISRGSLSDYCPWLWKWNYKNKLVSKQLTSTVMRALNFGNLVGYNNLQHYFAFSCSWFSWLNWVNLKIISSVPYP